jgi:hypothetical protein
MATRFLLAGIASVAMLAGITTTATAQRDELRERMWRNRVECDRGDRGACVRLGIIIGENRERRSEWQRERNWGWWDRR